MESICGLDDARLTLCTPMMFPRTRCHLVALRYSYHLAPLMKRLSRFSRTDAILSGWLILEGIWHFSFVFIKRRFDS